MLGARRRDISRRGPAVNLIPVYVGKTYVNQ